MIRWLGIVSSTADVTFEMVKFQGQMCCGRPILACEIDLTKDCCEIVPDWRLLPTRTTRRAYDVLGSSRASMYCVHMWRLHKGAESGATARPRHEVASSLRHLKRFKQSGSADLAADGVKVQAQAAAG